MYQLPRAAVLAASVELKLSGHGGATVYGKPATRSAATHGMDGVSRQ
ncbi:MAG: hypothetical protein V4462_18415 [Pseudomonadota bacterium]